MFIGEKNIITALYMNLNISSRWSQIPLNNLPTNLIALKSADKKKKRLR